MPLGQVGYNYVLRIVWHKDQETPCFDARYILFKLGCVIKLNSRFSIFFFLPLITYKGKFMSGGFAFNKFDVTALS